MRHYQPTAGIKDTAQNINFFLAANNPLLWVIFKPLIPFILILYAFDAIISGFFYSEDRETTFFLGAIVATYFYFVFIISWTRAVAIGQNNFTFMTPRNPNKHEMKYILFSFLMPVSLIVVLHILQLVLLPVDKSTYAFAVILSFITFMYVYFRLGFYFTALALCEDLSMSQSWALTKGYVTRMIFAPLLASIKLMMMMIVYLFSSGFIMVSILFAFLAIMAPEGDLEALLSPLLEQGRNPLELVNRSIVELLTYIMYLPAWIYFQPLLLAINTTSMTNFYLHAAQNRNDWTVKE